MSKEQHDLYIQLQFIRQSDDRYPLYQKLMEIMGVDDKLSMYDIEAFLLKAVAERFGESNTATDILLMDLGLLAGYDYNTEITITDRRAKFLQESYYLVHDKPSYFNADKKQRNAYQRRIGLKEDQLLEELSSFLIDRKKEEKIKELLDNTGLYRKNNKVHLPSPSYIGRENKEPPRNKTMMAVIKYLFSGKEIFSDSQNIVINKNNECEITIELAKGIATRSSAKPFIFFCVLVLCASGLTMALLLEHTSNKVQETGMEYQAEESIRKDIEKTYFKWDVRSGNVDTSTKNGKSSSPF